MISDQNQHLGVLHNWVKFRKPVMQEKKASFSVS